MELSQPWRGNSRFGAGSETLARYSAETLARPWREQTFAVVDCELTYLDSKLGEIIQIAASKYRDGKLLDSFSTLVRPEGRIPPRVTQLTGISEGSVAHAPSLRPAMGAL